MKPDDATKIGLLLAEYLLATRRRSKDIELYKECLYTASLGPGSGVQSLSPSTDSKYNEYHTGHRLAISLWHCGLVEEATEVVSKALETSKKGEDFLGQAICYLSAGMLCRTLGQLKESISNLKRAKKQMKAVGNSDGVALSLVYLGDAYVDLGQYEISKQCYEESLKFLENSSFKEGQALSLTGMGIVCRDRGNYKMAQDYFEKSLIISQEIQNKELVAKSHSYLASVYLAREEYR